MTEEQRIKETERMYLVDAERLSKIGELIALDAERVAAIERYQALDASRVDALDRYRELDAHRVELIERFQTLDEDRVAKITELTERLKLIANNDAAALDGQNIQTIERLQAQDVSRVEALERYRQLDTERVGQIERYQTLDTDRVAKINELTDRLTLNVTQARDAQRALTVEQYENLDASRVEMIAELLSQNVQKDEEIARLTASDTDRVTTINRLLELDTKRVEVIERLSAQFHSSDGMTISGRGAHFVNDPVFSAAWEYSQKANKAGWPDGVPDVRWRAHIALWAAKQGLKLEGDFVECGVHTGLLSLVICHALDFASLSRTFYLFDTFNGIPMDDLVEAEQPRIEIANENFYTDVFHAATANFAPYPNAKLVRGVLPKSLVQVAMDKIAYLSVDLNGVHAEKGVIGDLWDKVVQGAVVLIDDYDWIGCELQRDFWDEFAAKHGQHIATLPTGQGLLIKQ